MSGRINSLLLRELVNSNIQIGDVSIIVIKQGPLNKTKISENGKIAEELVRVQCGAYRHVSVFL